MRSISILVLFLFFFSIQTSSQSNSTYSNLSGDNDKVHADDYDYTINQPVSEDKGVPVGSFMIGALADVTFPFGETFKTYAGTGWSGHVFGGYSVLNSFIVSARVGYISFGEVETDYGLLQKNSQIMEGSSQSNNQWVISLGGQFLPILDPSCLSCFATVNKSGFNPFIGLSLCIIFKTYIYKLLEVQGFYKLENMTQAGNTFEENSTIFGITPSVGTYLNLSENINLILSADYYYLFDEADVGAANINYLSITFGAAYSFL